jgi:transcriptional regulator with XRE-family HTH domain
MNTASQIRNARNRLGWSQARLAIEADTSLSSIKRVEAGVLPSGTILQSIVDALGVPVMVTPADHEALR